MWKQRIHKCFHRAVGSALAIVALLNEFKQVDLSPFLNPQHSVLVVSSVSLVVIGLEFLPLMGAWLDGAEEEAKQ